MKSKDVRSIEARFIELLEKAPGTKADKQDFFRSRMKTTVARANYATMWDRLVASLGRVGAAEAVFEYALANATDKVGKMIGRGASGEEFEVRWRDPGLARLLFTKHGSPRAIGRLLLDYVLEIGNVPAAAPGGGDRGGEPSVGYEYDVALSFAGEQRPYVERVAQALRGRGVTVFYDRFEEVEMWGKDLVSFLEEVFREKARFCLMFLSRDYEQKRWPSWEGRAALTRVVSGKEGYLLPVRFDDTPFPGLPPAIKYLDGSALSPDELADGVVAKLHRVRP